MRSFLFGVMVPLSLLAFVIYVRAANDGLQRWHPFMLEWNLWLACVVLTSIFVGSGLRAYWSEGGWRQDVKHRPFDHDAVQRDADPD